MSSKTVSGGLLTIDHADVAMLTLNLADQAEAAVIAYAQQKNKGVFIKKAFASGHLTLSKVFSAQKAMQYVAAMPGITSVIVGTIDPVHLRENVAYAQQC